MVGPPADEPGCLVFPRLVDQGGHDGLSGAAFGIGGAFLLLPAEIALDQPLPLHLEGDAQGGEGPDQLRRVVRQRPHRPGVRQLAAAPQGIRAVLRRTVPLPHQVQCRVDAPLGQHGLGPLRWLGGDQFAAHILFCQFNRRRQPGQARADDNHSFHRFPFFFSPPLRRKENHFISGSSEDNRR